MPFQLKNLKILNPDPVLEEITIAVYEEFELNVITSAYRPEDTGVHGTTPKLRGLDLRCRNQRMGRDVEAWVNGRWKYDPNRAGKKCAMYHNAGKGDHLHLQVHPNTEKIQMARW